MAVDVQTQMSPGWPSGDVPQGATGPPSGSFDVKYVVFPAQTKEQERLLRELVEWSAAEGGGLDWQALLRIDHDAWGITED